MKMYGLSLATVVLAVSAFAANPAIGVATAVSIYLVDSLPVTGNATVADGTTLQTASAPTDVRLENGVSFRIATRSEGTLYGDHAVLRQGAARVSNFSGYPVDARGFQIRPDVPGAEAVIRLENKTVEIASIGGSVTVTDGGAMLTRVGAGAKMSFQQSGAASPDQNQQPTQTGAAPLPPAQRGPSEKKTLIWVIGISAVAALAIGLTAAAQGKSPF